MRRSQPFLVLFAAFSLAALLPDARSLAQSSKVMGEVRFEGDTSTDRDAGVWIDGEYVGYVKELKGNKKVLLLPGKHVISARESGYTDCVKEIVVEPGDLQTVDIKMSLAPGATEPKTTVELKVTIHPKRAAVFLDGNYVGHASELGGTFHSLLVSPGKHHIKAELPGYRTFETEVTLLPGQKSEVKTELIKGSIEAASSDIKKSQ
jgi:PEGA domain